MVSVIIIHFGPPAKTLQLLKSIEENAENSADYQVIVVDNGSPEPFSPELLQSSRSRLLRLDSGKGYSGACNQGRRAAQHQHLLFLNNDVAFDSDVPRLLFEQWQKLNSPGILGPSVVFPNGTPQASWGYSPNLFSEWVEQRTQLSMMSQGLFWFPLRQRLARKLRTVDWVSGVAMFTNTDVFDQVGGFDEAFPFYYEDTDLCRRVSLAGRRVYYDPNIRIIHELGGSHSHSRQPINERKWKGHLEYYKRHRSSWEFKMLELIYLWKKRNVG